MLRLLLSLAVTLGLVLGSSAPPAPADESEPLEELTAYLEERAESIEVWPSFAHHQMLVAMGLMAAGRPAEARALVDRFRAFPVRSLEYDAFRIAPGVSAVGYDPRDFAGADVFHHVYFSDSPQSQELALRHLGELQPAQESALRAGVDRVSGSLPGATGSPHELQVTAGAAARLASTGQTEDVRLALAARDYVLGHVRTDGSYPGAPATTSHVAMYLADLGVDVSASLDYVLQFRGYDGGLASPMELPMRPGVLYGGDYAHTARTVMAMTGVSPLTVGPSAARPLDLSDHPVAVRLYGATRYDTAAAVAARFPVGAPVFVASGENFPDALSGAALAGGRHGALLLVRQDGVPAATATALARLKPSSIRVLGGAQSISDGVLDQLRGHTTGTVSRIAGTDRYATSAAVAAEYDPSITPTVYVAAGHAFPDGLAGGAAAGGAGLPLLLTRQQGVPTSVMTQLERLDPQRIVVLGAAGAVGPDALAQLRRVAPVTVLSGSDRYATAAAVAVDLGTAPTAVVASGANWPDALAATALAATMDAPLLLSRPTSLPASTSSALRQLGTGKTFAIGGGGSLDPTVLDTLRRAPTP